MGRPGHILVNLIARILISPHFSALFMHKPSSHSTVSDAEGHFICCHESLTDVSVMASPSILGYIRVQLWSSVPILTLTC